MRLYFRGLRFKDPQNFQGLGFVSKVQGLGPVHTPVTRSTRGGLLRRCFEEANALVYRHTHSHLYTLPRAPYMHTYTHTQTSLPCSSRVGLHKASPHTHTRTQTHTYIPDLLNTRGTPCRCFEQARRISALTNALQTQGTPLQTSAAESPAS